MKIIMGVSIFTVISFLTVKESPGHSSPVYGKDRARTAIGGELK
jgi:hypothetical protein